MAAEELGVFQGVGATLAAGPEVVDFRHVKGEVLSDRPYRSRRKRASVSLMTLSWLRSLLATVVMLEVNHLD